jgi:SAM-dependent methyltransferase
MSLTEAQDAYGRAILDGHLGKPAYEVVERDDGYIGVSMGPPHYLAPHAEWPSLDKKAIRLARGRVLDVGCGGGRVGLHLAEKGIECVGIDNSPAAVETCHLRGFPGAVLCPFEQISRRRLGVFDTVVMLGNNWGLMAGVRRARIRLRRLHGMTTDRARIVAQSMDPAPPGMKMPECHRDYHRRNRDRGRLPGQLRIRVRYQRLKTPYFDYLLASPDEMREILDGTGWRISRLIEGSEGGRYVAQIVKE